MKSRLVDLWRGVVPALTLPAALHFASWPTASEKDNF